MKEDQMANKKKQETALVAVGQVDEAVPGEHEVECLVFLVEGQRNRRRFLLGPFRVGGGSGRWRNW